MVYVTAVFCAEITKMLLKRIQIYALNIPIIVHFDFVIVVFAAHACRYSVREFDTIILCIMQFITDGDKARVLCGYVPLLLNWHVSVNVLDFPISRCYCSNNIFGIAHTIYMSLLHELVGKC